MGCKVFGRREGVPYFVNASAGIEDAVFCMIDATATKERGVKVATAAATVFDGVVGVVQTGIWHGHYGTSADPYPQNADINVVSNGQVRVKISQTTSTETDYLADGNLVTIGTGGKAVKFTAPTLGAAPDNAAITAFVKAFQAVVGRCIGDPVDGVVTIEIIGLGGIQQG